MQDFRLGTAALQAPGEDGSAGSSTAGGMAAGRIPSVQDSPSDWERTEGRGKGSGQGPGWLRGPEQLLRRDSGVSPCLLGKGRGGKVSKRGAGKMPKEG